MSDNIEARDYIARAEGWNPPGTDPPKTGNALHDAIHATMTRGAWWRPCEDGINIRAHDHPIPNTLDEAARLPEGWAVQIHQCKTFNNNYAWMAHAYLNNGEASCHADCPTELEARFALRVAVLKHIAEKEQTNA